MPENLVWRQRVGASGEWTGRSGGEALAQWQVVAAQAPTAETWAALIRVAPSLTAPGELASAAEALALVARARAGRSAAYGAVGALGCAAAAGGC